MFMNKLLSLLLTLFLFSSVYAESRVVDKLEYRDGIAYAVGESGGFSGTWVNTGLNSNKVSELNYKNGLQDGLTTRWYANRIKGTEANYKDGKLHGTATEWKGNGVVKSRVNYINGNKLEATFYYETAEIEKVEKYVNGKHSKTTHYHKTGEIRLVAEFDNTKRKKTTHYYKTGKVKEIYDFVDGSVSEKIFYSETGKIEEVDEYDNSKISKINYYGETGEVDRSVEINQAQEYSYPEYSYGSDYRSATVYDMVIGGLIIIPILAKYISYYRKAENTSGRIFWTITTFYLVAWIFGIYFLTGLRIIVAMSLPLYAGVLFLYFIFAIFQRSKK